MLNDGEADQEDFRYEYGNRAPRMWFRECGFCREEEAVVDTYEGWACKECAIHIGEDRMRQIREGSK